MIALAHCSSRVASDDDIASASKMNRRMEKNGNKTKNAAGIGRR